QADPLLLAKREDELAWHWDSGTSFAQPNFSGVCLLMKDVNPELSWDEIYAIIEETSVAGSDINLRGVTIDDPITVIDPMAALSQAAQLPGSQYKGTRLDRFLASLE
ncbi:S8 family serine peptidase, partial [bacterium]|nr:S8 family serine peptidase [bacterium]